MKENVNQCYTNFILVFFHLAAPLTLLCLRRVGYLLVGRRVDEFRRLRLVVGAAGRNRRALHCLDLCQVFLPVLSLDPPTATGLAPSAALLFRGGTGPAMREDVDGGLEGEGLGGGELGQDLPVQQYVRALLLVDEAAVHEPVLAGTGREALDPQSPPVPLLHLPIPVRVLPRLLHLRDGDLEAVLAPPPEALGVLQQALVLCLFSFCMYI
jgi:hypothetical protein